MSKLRLASRKAKAQENCKAWWYENRTHIDIFIATQETGPTVYCRINRRALESYLRKCKP